MSRGSGVIWRKTAALCSKFGLRKGLASGFNLRLVAKCQIYCKTYILIRGWYL